MAKLKSYCPYCNGIVQAGQHCGCRKAKRKPTQGDATRGEREPWRKAYGEQDYQANRQVAIARSDGCCIDCTARVAVCRGGRWYTAELGGEVDHIVPLCEGGTNDASNLALRCKGCHGKAEAARRRRRS